MTVMLMILIVAMMFMRIARSIVFPIVQKGFAFV